MEWWDIRAAPIKRTAVERQVNTQIVFLFIVLLALSLSSTIGSSIRQVNLPSYDRVPLKTNYGGVQWFFAKNQWYLFSAELTGNKGALVLHGWLDGLS